MYRHGVHRLSHLGDADRLWGAFSQAAWQIPRTEDLRFGGALSPPWLWASLTAVLREQEPEQTSEGQEICQCLQFLLPEVPKNLECGLPLLGRQIELL